MAFAEHKRCCNSLDHFVLPLYLCKSKANVLYLFYFACPTRQSVVFLQCHLSSPPSPPQRIKLSLDFLLQSLHVYNLVGGLWSEMKSTWLCIFTHNERNIIWQMNYVVYGVMAFTEGHPY